MVADMADALNQYSTARPATCYTTPRMVARKGEDKTTKDDYS